MLRNIPKNRIIMYLVILGLIPVLFACFYVFTQASAIQDLDNNIELIQNQALVIEQKQAVNNAVRYHYRDADHLYIGKNL